MRFLRFIISIYLLALAFILFYKFRFLFDYSIIVYHLLVLSMCILGLFSFSLLTSYIRTKRLASLIDTINASIWAVFVSLLILTYPIIVVGKDHGAGILPFTVLYDHLKSFNSVLELAGISRTLAYTCGSLIILALLLFTLYLRPVISSGISDFRVYIRRFIAAYAENSVRSKRIDQVMIILLVLACSVLFYRQPFHRRVLGAHEPLSAMVFGETDFMGMFHFAQYTESPEIRKIYPRNTRFHKKNVVLIIVDALRAENLSMYGYTRFTSPFMQQLCKSGKLQKVDYAFSTSAASFPGILSILRSKPAWDLAQQNFSVSELLHDEGYKINYILSGDHANWYDMKYFYGKSIDFFFDGSQSSLYVCDDQLVLDGLDKVNPYHDTASFFYFHLMSVHYAGLRHPESRKWTPASIDEDSIPYRNGYDNGIMQADHYIEKIFKGLQKKGYLENSIVIITADHGESLGERNSYGHVNNVYNEEIRIPLLIYDTDTTVRYDKRDFAEQPDIAATIVDRLGLPIPSSWKGTSLLRDTFEAYTYHSVSERYAIIHYAGKNIYKYHYNTKDRKEELYNVKSDVLEQNNIILKADRSYLAMLRDKMDKFLSLHKNY